MHYSIYSVNSGKQTGRITRHSLSGHVDQFHCSQPLQRAILNGSWRQELSSRHHSYGNDWSRLIRVHLLQLFTHTHTHTWHSKADHTWATWEWPIVKGSLIYGGHFAAETTFLTTGSASWNARRDEVALTSWCTDGSLCHWRFASIRLTEIDLQVCLRSSGNHEQCLAKSFGLEQSCLMFSRATCAV